MELLAVVTIIALLVALLLPVVRTIRDAAQSAGCKSQQRQIGLALLMYADQWDGLLPPRYVRNGDLPAEWLNDRLYMYGGTAVWTHPRFIGSTLTEYDLVDGQVPARSRSLFRCPATGRATASAVPNLGMSGLASPDIWGTLSAGRWYGRLPLAGFHQASLVAIVTDVSDPRWEPQPGNMTSAAPGVSVGWSTGQWSPSLPIRRHTNGINLLFADGHIGFSRETREDELRGVYRVRPR